jgi:hypothetical protein
MFTALSRQLIFTPPLTALGSFHIRVTSSCITSQVSGDLSVEHWNWLLAGPTSANNYASAAVHFKAAP